MSALRSTVYIPLVELTGQPGRLLEIYCEEQGFGESVLDDRSLDKNWQFVAAPLRPVGLYEDGLLAVNVVRKLGLKTPLGAVYQHFKKLAWLDNQRLHPVSVIDCEGSSGQLGLAVALLLNAGRSPIRHAVATGKLSNDTRKNQHYEQDVAIESVNSIPEKLQLLIAKRETLPKGPLFCFTPSHYFEDGQARSVNDLPEVETLRRLEVYVKPIDWLSEAATLLQADKSRYLRQDKAWAAGITAAAVLSLCAALYHVWLTYPIPVHMLAGRQKPEPFLVCTDRAQSNVSYHDLQRDGGTPIFPVFAHENIAYNVGIAWKLRPEPTPLSGRYYVAFIHLGEKTGFKLINKPADGSEELTVSANDTLQWYWPMAEESAKPQDNVLMIALQRTPIDADEINQQFVTRFPASKPLDVLKARDFLLPRFPGSYTFSYQSIVSDPPCAIAPSP